MDILNAITSRRTIRMYEQRPILLPILRELVDAARLAPSASNLQPLEFIAVADTTLVEQVFPLLAWAGAVAPRRTPPAGKRPVAYIVVLINRAVRVAGGYEDAGAAIENLLLAAWTKGIGGCWIASVDRDHMRELMDIPSHLEVNAVVALGYPAEHPVWEEAADSTTYYLDEQDQLHVPKRRLDAILHENHYRQ